MLAYTRTRIHAQEQTISVGSATGTRGRPCRCLYFPVTLSSLCKWGTWPLFSNFELFWVLFGRIWKLVSTFPEFFPESLFSEYLNLFESFLFFDYSSISFLSRNLGGSQTGSSYSFVSQIFVKQELKMKGFTFLALLLACIMGKLMFLQAHCPVY